MNQGGTLLPEAIMATYKKIKALPADPAFTADNGKLLPGKRSAGLSLAAAIDTQGAMENRRSKFIAISSRSDIFQGAGIDQQWLAVTIQAKA